MKRSLPLYGNATPLCGLVETAKIIRVKSNYYSPKYALELLVTLSGLLGGTTEVVFESAKFGIRPNTLRLLISSAWAYLIDHGPELMQREGITDEIDWNAIRILRQRCKISVLTIGVALTVKYKSLHEIVRPKVLWNVALQEWLQGDMKQDFLLEDLELSPENLRVLNNILGSLEGVDYLVNEGRIEIRRKQI